jgi:cytochrome c biogenesis protein CcdA
MNLVSIIEAHKNNLGIVFGITMIFIIIALILVGLGGLKEHKKGMLIGATFILTLIGFHQMFMLIAVNSEKVIEMKTDYDAGKQMRVNTPESVPTVKLESAQPTATTFTNVSDS